MTPKLHLVVDFSHLQPGGANGGVKPFFFELLRWLSLQEELPLRLTYLTNSNTHGEVRELLQPDSRLVCVRHFAGQPVRLEGGWRRRETSVPAVPPDLLLQLQADVLYCPFGSTEFHCPGVPTICLVADLLHRDYPATLNAAELSCRETMFRDICRHADFFQCISRFAMERLHHHFQVPRERMFCTHIAIHERFPALPSAVDRPPALPPGPFFLYPANAWTHKNHETLLVAYRSYLRRAGGTAWPLVLTFHESERARYLRDCAQRLRLGDAVRFLGYLNLAQFSALWQEAGALVFPSLYEGFGIPPIEAMHFGVPVICSREGSLPEVVGDAAYLVDGRRPDLLADAMLKVAGDKSLRLELIVKGRQRLSAFRLPAEAGKLLGAIRAAQQVLRKSAVSGVHGDGWTGRRCVIALPPFEETATVALDLHPIAVPRRVRLYRGSVPLGGFALEAASPGQVRVRVRGEGGPLLIEVPDAGPIGPEDRRELGVRVRQVSMVLTSGEEQSLLGPL